MYNKHIEVDGIEIMKNIKQLIEKFEKRLEGVKMDQMTTFDDMHPKKFEGFVQAYEEVIEELKKSLKN